MRVGAVRAVGTSRESKGSIGVGRHWQCHMANLPVARRGHVLLAWQCTGSNPPHVEDAYASLGLP